MLNQKIYYLVDHKGNSIVSTFVAENDDVAIRAITATISQLKSSNNCLLISIYKDCKLYSITPTCNDVVEFDMVKAIEDIK